MDDARALHAPRRMLVTGGAGFIGCNWIRWSLERDPALRVVALDALTYAGNRANLSATRQRHRDRLGFEVGDVRDATLVERLLGSERIDTVIHFAAESHVDRSIDDPVACVGTNVLGTATLLDAARRAWRGREDVRFHHVGTDEVYGPVADGAVGEGSSYDPSSPYSASKAAADHLARAWHRTYGLPVTVSVSVNNYGAFQHPEKLIPLMILAALGGKPLPVYGDGENAREWLHVDDHCTAIDAIVRRGRPGRIYHVASGEQRRNIDVVRSICDLVDGRAPRGAPTRALISFVTDRPGHDRRYALDSTRIATELGWRPQVTFADGLARTVDWYLANLAWAEAAGAHARARHGLV